MKVWVTAVYSSDSGFNRRLYVRRIGCCNRLALLRANLDKVSCAVSGSGSHVASAFFQKETATRLHLVPQALGAFRKSEIAKWWPIIKAAGIKGE